MNNNIYQIKNQTCNLCNALLRNINDNFESVSFEILKNGDIQLRIILHIRTEVENEYIEDMIAEFGAVQQNNCVREPEILVGQNKTHLENLVYQIL